MAQPRFLLHARDYRYPVFEVDDLYALEADGDETLVRLRARRRRRDVRSFGEVLARLEPHGFVEIYRGIAVNAAHVRELRRDADEERWEVRMRPPVNLVLPVAERRVARVRKVLAA